MTSHLAHAMRRGLMGPGHVRNLEAALGKRAGALTAAEKGLARANIGADTIGGFRNKIINGDFDIWQRGTSLPTPALAGGVYLADRWRCSGTHTGSTATFSRQAFPLGQADVPGSPRYFARYERSVSGPNLQALMQRIEGVRTLAGRRATLTFYARGTAGKHVTIWWVQSFGTGGSPSANVEAWLSPIKISAQWQRFSIVIDFPSIAGKSLGTVGNDFLGLEFELLASEGNMTLDIARVSLVEGDATAEADPFSPRHLQQEEALCQRYFERIARTYYSVGFARVTTGIESVLSFVRKRTTPAVSASDASTFRVFRQGAGGFQYNAGTSLALGAGGLDAIRFGLGFTDTTGIVAADAAIIVDAGAGASYIDIDAEL